jgi:hypothetical protein
VENHGGVSIVSDYAQGVLELVGSDVSEHSHSTLILPQDRESSIFFDGYEVHELVSKRRDGILFVESDGINVKVGLERVRGVD